MMPFFIFGREEKTAVQQPQTTPKSQLLTTDNTPIWPIQSITGVELSANFRTRLWAKNTNTRRQEGRATHPCTPRKVLHSPPPALPSPQPSHNLLNRPWFARGTLPFHFFTATGCPSVCLLVFCTAATVGSRRQGVGRFEAGEGESARHEATASRRAPAPHRPPEERLGHTGKQASNEMETELGSMIHTVCLLCWGCAGEAAGGKGAG